MYTDEAVKLKQFASAKIPAKHIWQEAVLACRSAVKEFTDKHGEPRQVATNTVSLCTVALLQLRSDQPEVLL